MTEPNLVPQPAREQASRPPTERQADQPNEPLTEAESGQRAAPHIDELLAKTPSVPVSVDGQVNVANHTTAVGETVVEGTSAVNQEGTVQALLTGSTFGLAEAAELERLLLAERRVNKEV